MFDIGNQEVKILTVGDVSGKILDIKDQRAWEDDWKPTPNTIAYWPLDYNSLTNDLSGHGNNLTSTGSPVFGKLGCKFGSGITLHTNEINGWQTGSNPLTICFWYLSSIEARNQYPYSRYGDDTSTRWFMQQYASSNSNYPNYFRPYWGGTVAPALNANFNGSPAGVWKNIVLTYSGNTINAYVNGVEKASASISSLGRTAPTSSYPFVIGGRSKGDTSYNLSTNARLSRFVIANEYRPLAMVLDFFNKTKKRYGIS